MELQYDIPVEVTELQYRRIMTELKGVCAGKITDGKYYIKLWLTNWRANVIWILETT